MRRIYLAPTALAPQIRQQAEMHFHPCPGNATWCLVFVDWLDDDAQDAWEGTQGVTSLAELLDKPLPAAAVVLLTTGPWSWGVQPTDTVRQALQRIRTAWSPARRLLLASGTVG